MNGHPCDDGLSRSCFKVYPKWVKQALAYKFLYVLLPKEALIALKTGLDLPFIGPGAILPPGVELPTGSIIPPDFNVPPNWIPWFHMIFTTDDDPRGLFPVDWKFGDTLPIEIKLLENYIIPNDWTTANPPHPVFLPGYNPFPRPDDWSGGVPLYVGAFEPGPVHRPAPAPPSPWVSIFTDTYWETGICPDHLVPYYVWNGVYWEHVHGQ